ncbi:ATP-binding protein [uncultured Clostridium sp.]|uniref:sensor histidine kinase n=1 Tax=uncultured Clostridium sp. TaxID=59620 RepID=UPI002632051A|nr:ATP-binding protein [uncultured Clostridium sp.]
MNALLNIIFSLILYIKMDIVLEKRINNKKIHYILYFIFLILNYIGIFILESISNSLSSLFMIISYFLFIIIFYKNKISEKLLILLITLNTMLYMIIFLVYTLLISGYLVGGNIQFVRSMANTFVIIIGIIFNIIEIKSLKYWKNGYFFSLIRNRITRKYVYGTLFLSFIGIFTYITLNNDIVENEKNVLIFGYFIIIFVFIIIVMTLIKFKNKILNYIIEKSNLEVKIKAINEEKFILKESDKDRKIIWHDIKKHNLILQHLIEKNKIDEAIDYLERMNTEINNSEKRKITKNIIVNSIINLALHECEKNNIKYNVDIILPKIINIEPFHLTVILGNILDNAIEENKRLEGIEKYINIYSFIEKNRLNLIVENPCRIKTGLTEKNLKTSKKITENHGLGIESIKKAVKEYSGEIIIENEDYKFKIIVYIPLEKGDKND